MVTVQDIIETTAKHYGFTTGQMLSENRGQPLAFARQVAMKLSRDLTTASYPEIAREFNNRDHTTIIHGFRKVESKAANNPEFEEEYRKLMSKVVLGKTTTSLSATRTKSVETKPPESKPETPTIKIYRKGLYSKWKRCQYWSHSKTTPPNDIRK